MEINKTAFHGKKQERASRLYVSERRTMIDSDHYQFSMSKQCDLTEFLRSRFNCDSNSVTESDDNLTLMSLIDEEFMRRFFLGVRRTCSYLRRPGHVISRQRDSV
jgi:putative transposase